MASLCESSPMVITVHNASVHTGCSLLTSSRPVQSAGHVRGTHVPRILHQMYRERQLPPLHRAYQHTWSRLHPDWTIVLWTDDELRQLVRWHYPWFEPTLEKARHWVSVADACRSLLLHRFGGAYMDLDVEAFQPLDDVIPPGANALLSEPADPAHMLSRAGHPLWMWTVRHYSHSIGAPGVFDAAGPGALEKSLKEYEAFVSAQRHGGARAEWSVSRFSLFLFAPKPFWNASMNGGISIVDDRATSVVPCHRTLGGCSSFWHRAKHLEWLRPMWGYHHCTGGWWRGVNALARLAPSETDGR